MVLRTALLLFAVMLCASAAAASPIVLVSETRYVEASYLLRDAFDRSTVIEDSEREEPTAPFAAFNAFTASVDASSFGNAFAEQQSVVTPDLFSVFVNARAFGDDGTLEVSTARSSFSVVFDVPQATEMALDTTANTGNGWGRIVLSRWDPLRSRWDSVFGLETDASLIETLAPGSYRFNVWARALSAQSLPMADLDVTATFTVVPEPSSGLLIGLGLVAVGRLQRPTRPTA